MKYYLTPTGIKQCRLTPEQLFRKLLVQPDDRPIPPQAMELFNRTIAHDNIVFRHPKFTRDHIMEVYGFRYVSDLKTFDCLEDLADACQREGIVLMVSQTEIVPDTEVGMNSLMCSMEGANINPMFRKLFIDRTLKTI